MSESYLEELYKEGYLKRGCSERVDQAIADIWLLRTDQFNNIENRFTEELLPISEEGFDKRWMRFVEATMDEFPNIQPYNITSFTVMLVAYERKHENLYICQLVEALAPSSESMCSLGNAYTAMWKYYRATHCYEQAYQRAVKHVEKHKLAADNPLMLDAVDYLRHKAESLIETNLPADALVTLTHAFQIVKQAGERVQFKLDDLCRMKIRAFEKAGWWEPHTSNNPFA